MARLEAQLNKVLNVTSVKIQSRIGESMISVINSYPEPINLRIVR